MLFVLYKIRNKINGKIYIGKHKTKNLDDGYLGSGLIIKRAVKKYGEGAFTRRVLAMFETEAELNAAEREMVTAEFCKRKDTYNVIPGGHGGFNHLNSVPLLMSIRGKKGIEIMRRMMDKKHGKGWNEKASRMGGQAAKAMRKGIHSPTFTGPTTFRNNPELQKRATLKAASPEVRAGVHKTFIKIKHQKGKKNSQYGMVWITNGLESQKVEPRFVGLWELDGWRLGRTMPVKARRGCRIIPPQISRSRHADLWAASVG